MNDIKFRAWDKTNNCWIDMCLVAINPDGGQLLSATGDELVWSSHSNYEVMQYTGLKDKNGREIYVGDILANDEIHRGNFHAVVEDLSSGSFRGVTIPGRNHNRPLWNIMHDEGSQYDEVIGNIYENPELLK